jgi:hypothetical protein
VWWYKHFHAGFVMLVMPFWDAETIFFFLTNASFSIRSYMRGAKLYAQFFYLIVCLSLSPFCLPDP